MTEDEFAAKLPKCSRCHLPILEGDALSSYLTRSYKFKVHLCGYPEEEYWFPKMGRVFTLYEYDSTSWDMFDYIMTRIDHIDT
jgi:hypothetical protein